MSCDCRPYFYSQQEANNKWQPFSHNILFYFFLILNIQNVWIFDKKPPTNYSTLVNDCL